MSVIENKVLVSTSLIAAIVCVVLMSSATASQPAQPAATPPTGPTSGPVTAISGTTSSEAPNPAEATQTGLQAAERMVCRSQTNLGSRLGKRRVCRTAAEWELMRRDAQQAVDARQRMNSAGRSKGDGG
jgi:hypothetical protein